MGEIQTQTAHIFNVVASPKALENTWWRILGGKEN